MPRRTFYASFLLGAALIVTGGSPAAPQPSTEVERRVEPVILQGANIPVWSRLPAIGLAEPWPSGSNEVVSEVRDAHNGTFFIPADDPLRAVMPDDIVGFKWTGTGWTEIPVQVDQRFPYFLANGRSDFGFYSGTDEELTYQWDVESWKKIGESDSCFAHYPADDPSRMEGYPTKDPIEQFDDDDELVFMASDAGDRAPTEAPAPDGASEEHQEISLTDPLTGDQTYVYLFLSPSGPSFDTSDGYVDYVRDVDADEFIDRTSFTDDSTEKLGSSNTGYGPNLPGDVCGPQFTGDLGGAEPGTARVRASNDRFPRDGVTVTTDSYRWRATGRWMVREMQVASVANLPGCMRGNGCAYGEDLIDRWKGRAFQQTPDSTISQVGFEDEQVNWEANAALLGERRGPVRAIREVWGADSGTNTTKREYFYRDLIVNRYFLRVHPIPPDGIYTSWDHNANTVATYYNEQTPDGVAIDGDNDDEGNVDEAPFVGPAYFDATDPTFSRPISLFNWEQVAGTQGNGSVVYMFQLNNVQGAETPQVIPYYRDDQCFDDGTGDDPVKRPWPGESQADERLDDYRDLNCLQDEPLLKQGCFGCHGIHYLITNDTDNAFLLKPTTEVDGQQYQWAAPTAMDTNVGDRYANTVKFALQPSAVLILTSGPDPDPSASPSPDPDPSGSGDPDPDPDPSDSPDGSSPSPGSSPGSPGPGGSIPPGSVNPSPGGSASPSSGSSPPATIGPGGSAGPGSPSPSTSPEPSFAQGDPEGRVTTTIERENGKVPLMEPTVFSGRIGTMGRCDGPYTLSLYRKQFGEETFTQVAAVQNLRNGDVWRQRAAARRNSQFVARVDGPSDDATPCRAGFSDPVTLLVKVKIRVIHLRPCLGPHMVNGVVRPSQPGTRVFLQRVGGLRRIDGDRVGTPSRFSLRAPGCGRYQVVWPKQGKRNIGNSAGA